LLARVGRGHRRRQYLRRPKRQSDGPTEVPHPCL
jgi:hypothetical protein